MRKSRAVWIVLTVVIAVGLVGAPADAQNIFRRVTGIAVTQTGTSGVDGLTAEFDVTLNTTGSPRGVFSPAVTSYGRPAPPYQGHIGNYYSVQTYGGFGTPVRARLTIANPQINAIEFGSGTPGTTALSSTVLPAVTPGTPGAYRGSFMHTYPAAGAYNMKVGATFNINVTNATPAAQVITSGYPVQVAAGQPFSWTSVFKFYGPTTTNTLAFTYSGGAAQNQTVGVTNLVNGGTAAGGGIIVGGTMGPAIPTASEIGLIALATALAAAGVFFLKR